MLVQEQQDLILRAEFLGKVQDNIKKPEMPMTGQRHSGWKFAHGLL